MSAAFDVVFSIAVCGTCVMAVIAPWLLMRAAEMLLPRGNRDSFMAASLPASVTLTIGAATSLLPPSASFFRRTTSPLAGRR